MHRVEIKHQQIWRSGPYTRKNDVDTSDSLDYKTTSVPNCDNFTTGWRAPNVVHVRFVCDVTRRIISCYPCVPSRTIALNNKTTNEVRTL